MKLACFIATLSLVGCITSTPKTRTIVIKCVEPADGDGGPYVVTVNDTICTWRSVDE